jgi:hypothetical protein
LRPKVAEVTLHSLDAVGGDVGCTGDRQRIIAVQLKVPARLVNRVARGVGGFTAPALEGGQRLQHIGGVQRHLR